MPPSSPSPTFSESESETVFELRTPKYGRDARAVLTEAEFVVLAGSIASPQWRGKTSQHTGYSKLHTELTASGVLVPEGEICVFSENYAFDSPSAAAAIVNGGATNGTIEWRLPSGRLTKHGRLKSYKRKKLNDFA